MGGPGRARPRPPRLIVLALQLEDSEAPVPVRHGPYTDHWGDANTPECRQSARTAFQRRRFGPGRRGPRPATPRRRGPRLARADGDARARRDASVLNEN